MLLTNLADASGHHEYTYRQYDNNYRLVLAAEPSAVTAYSLDGNGNWNGSAPSFTTGGLVRETVYYADTTAGENTAGSAAGYTAVEVARATQGPSDPVREFTSLPTLPLSDTNAAILSSYQYFAHTGTDSSGNATTVYPIATATVYPDAAGSTAVATSYAYTWYSGTVQIQQRTTYLPIIPSGQNGSGSQATRMDYYDAAGHLTWQQDERGRITAHVYDAGTGLLTETIQDASSAGNTGWTVPSDALNLVTNFSYDTLGRAVQVLGPAHNVDGQNLRTAAWTVYDDPNHQLRTGRGYQAASSGTFTLVNPVSIQKYDAENRLLESIQATRGSGVTDSGKLLPSDTFAQSSYVRWTVNQYTKTRLTKTAVYFHIPSDGSDPDSDGFVGATGTDYNVAQYGYEAAGGSGTLMGRRNKVTSPGGTIARTVLDVRGRAIATYVGTNDAGATDADPTGSHASGNNMVQITGQQFDADGNLTQVSQYVDATTTRVTNYGYDWRDRQVTTTTSDDANTYLTQSILDNQGRVVEVDRFYTPSGGTATLMGCNTTSYDNLGRAYQGVTYAVSSGTVGTGLVSNTWSTPRATRSSRNRPAPRPSSRWSTMAWAAPPSATLATTRPRRVIPIWPTSSITTRFSSRRKPLSTRRATSPSSSAAAGCTTPPAPAASTARAAASPLPR